MKTFSPLMGIVLLACSTTFAQENPNWIRVTENAGWQPRDSSGEAVFRDRLWLLGGWFQSFEAPRRVELGRWKNVAARGQGSAVEAQ